MSVYDFSVTDAENNKINLKDYYGKVLLIVNTATGCGFTPQYEGLEALYRKYNKNGFEILDFPCNQFGNQAPGSEKEIQEFCKLKYDVSFKQFKKIKVNGEDASPLFDYLKSQTGGIFGKKIKWNFTKFLVGRNGKVLKRFAPNVTPQSIESYIRAVL